MAGRMNWIFASFMIAILFLVGHQLFATAWSNKCDPGNAQFFLMKNDPIVSFHPGGEMFTWENDGPDNSWLCSDASLSVSFIGPQVGAMFSATRDFMSQDGWTGGDIIPEAPDFTVFEKTTDKVKIDAVVREQAFWVEVDMNVPGLHPGEYGFR